MEQVQGKATRISLIVYTSVSLSAALAFFVIASVLGKYTPTAVYGGAGWVFILSMIVTMPTVTPWIKKRLKT